MQSKNPNKGNWKKVIGLWGGCSLSEGCRAKIPIKGIERDGIRVAKAMPIAAAMQSKNPNKGNWKSIVNLISPSSVAGCRAKIPIKGIESKNPATQVIRQIDEMQSKNPNKGNWKSFASKLLAWKRSLMQSKNPNKGNWKKEKMLNSCLE